jgi:hypothetical protein
MGFLKLKFVSDTFIVFCKPLPENLFLRQLDKNSLKGWLYGQSKRLQFKSEGNKSINILELHLIFLSFADVSQKVKPKRKTGMLETSENFR